MKIVTWTLMIAAVLFSSQLTGQASLENEKQKQRNMTVVYQAIKSGKVNVPDTNGYTPLQMAAMWATDAKVINDLVKAGADVHHQPESSWPAVHMAAMDNRNPEVIKAFITAGVNINVRDRSENTPLAYAVYCGNSEVAVALIELGADVKKIIDADTGKTLLMEKLSPEVFQLLIKHGVDVNAHDKNGATALMLAASRRNVTAGEFEMLIKAGAEINAIDNNGRTALMYAANRTDLLAPKSVFALRSLGAEVGLKDKEGKTALDHAKANDTFIGSHVYMLLEETLHK